MSGNFKIGIISDMLRMPFRESIETCAELGADGIQLYAVEGEMAPEHITAEGIREHRKFIAGSRFTATPLEDRLSKNDFNRAAGSGPVSTAKKAPIEWA